MRLSPSSRRVVRIAAAAASVIAIVLAFHLYPRTGADRVRHLIAWPSGCASITTGPPAPDSAIHAWTVAVQRELIQCQAAGPLVLYARFANVAERDSALRQAPAPGRSCLAGREVILDGLDNGFPALCRDLHGRLVSNPGTLLSGRRST
jgi:hypothetical protein